jgi:ubiquinone biosynthesis accessory factor UbiJ
MRTPRGNWRGFSNLADRHSPVVNTVVNYPVVKFLNRVLSDYPMARDLLTAHAGKSITAEIGPISAHIRVSAYGEFEMVGTTDNARPPTEGLLREAAPDVAFRIPLRLLPRLARGDESAFSEVVFEGDSEFASALSSVARNVDWDIEEDLSQVIGDIGAKRIVGGANTARQWSNDAEARLMVNVAEYLTEEKRAFATKRDVELLATDNENLRDALARLEAKINASAAHLA